MAKRADCGRSPCNAPTAKPCLVSERVSTSTSRLRLQNTMAFCSDGSRSRRRRVSRLLYSSTTTRPVSMVVATDDSRLTVISLGACKKASASLRMAGAIVAEKNRVCRLSGSRLTIFSISGINPISSIRSASSITRIRVWVKSNPPRSNRSSRRPGVAISTSTPRFSTSFWSAMLSPPISRAWVSLRCLP